MSVHNTCSQRRSFADGGGVANSLPLGALHLSLQGRRRWHYHDQPGCWPPQYARRGADVDDPGSSIWPGVGRADLAAWPRAAWQGVVHQQDEVADGGIPVMGTLEVTGRERR